MNCNEKLTIQTAIDTAIATVAEEQFLTLAGDIEDSSTKWQVAEAIYASLGSLDLLRKDQIPNYNRWDALFYLTWYQPSQINLVYSLISENSVSSSEGEPPDLMPSLFETGSDTVRIADFGCGCLATSFGVALAAADAYSRGQDIPEIIVDCIDSSPDMIHIGQKTWDRFRETILSVDRDHPICSVLEKINSRVLSQTSESKPNIASEYVPCIVTAIHCLYTRTIGTVKRALDELISCLNPVAVILTTDTSKENLLDSVFSQKSTQTNYRLLSSGEEPQTRLESSFLKSTTEWRQKLNSMFSDDLFRLSHFKFNGECFSFGRDYRSYLINNVKWWKNDFCHRVFIQ